MNDTTVIELKNVFKSFNLKNGYQKDKLNVLEDINLSVKKGDRIGIIGNNGAGKTVLFKLISGIIRPDNGTIKTKGKIVSLINLEDGFKLDLSGRENILLNGLLVGMTKKEILSRIDEIINFSGIENYIDSPFYTYSSGMKFRLAFAIAIASRCDILIIDEIFLTGDYYYQLKMLNEIKSFKEMYPEMSLMISTHVPIFLLGLVDKCFEINNSKLIPISIKQLEKIAKKRDNNIRDVLMVDHF